MDGKRKKQSKHHNQAALHGARIEDYALIGDCETAALVSNAGSIDWLCWPSFSSPACFAGLLGDRDHGYWKIAPTQKVTRQSRRYQEGTLIVETYFKTRAGEVCLTDFMPIREKHSQLIRIVTGIEGAVRMRMDLAIRFDYGRTIPWVTSNSELRAVAGSDMVVLQTDAELRGDGPTTVSDFTIKKGETLSFTLLYCSSLEKMPGRESADKALQRTQKFWQRWSRKSNYRGDYADAVSRSILTLKAMTYRPTGGIVAAVTTSLPEDIGGERNWDYRFCWLRDAAFTLMALLRAGHRDEALEWRRWLLRSVAGAPDQVQTIYGINGERDLNEWEASWLPGYLNSRPVRIGNGASGQFQLDVFGEVASTLVRIPEAEDDFRVPALDVLIELTDHLCKVWHLPDEGIWEVRGGPRHFVHSKVMAWVALDRAIQYLERKKADENDAAVRRELSRFIDEWSKVRTTIHEEVCRKGFNKKLNSFVQSYGSDALDASCLRIALVGFLPPTDPRILGTVEAIEKDLLQDGFVMRYRTDTSVDGLRGNEGQFLACSFWMVSCLHLIGRRDEAREMLQRLMELRNDVGLLSEEYDTKAGRMCGNFPQALSHIALIHAVFTISGDWEPQPYVAETTHRRARRSK